MLHDLQSRDYSGQRYLFWNTYNAQPLPVTTERPAKLDNIPPAFERYFDSQVG